MELVAIHQATRRCHEPCDCDSCPPIASYTCLGPTCASLTASVTLLLFGWSSIVAGLSCVTQLLKWGGCRCLVWSSSGLLEITIINLIRTSCDYPTVVSAFILHHHFLVQLWLVMIPLAEQQVRFRAFRCPPFLFSRPHCDTTKTWHNQRTTLLFPADQ